jgi:hypothetical protein
VTELHEALLLWIVARQALSSLRALAPLTDPSSEPFSPLA